MINNNLTLFAASNDQKRYFDLVKMNIPDDVQKVVWYKDMSLWSHHPLTKTTLAAIIAEPVAMLIKRKQGLQKKSFPWLWVIYGYWLKIRATWLARQYAKWLAHEPAHWIGVWNGKKFRQAVLVNTAKAMGKSVLFFETGPLPGYSMIDPYGVNAHSSIPKIPAFYEHYAQQQELALSLNQQMTDNLKVNQIQKVFVPFQVVEDSNIYMHSTWIPSMYALFEQIKSLAQHYPSIDFLLKTHPSCHLHYDDLVTHCLPNMHFVKDQSVTDVIQSADAVITINSTVGIEAIMQHKPVIVLGDALYDFYPLSLKANSAEELEDHFKKVYDGWLPPYQLVVAFLHYLRHEYAIVGNAMKNPTKKHFLAVREKLERLL